MSPRFRSRGYLLVKGKSRSLGLSNRQRIWDHSTSDIGMCFGDTVSGDVGDGDTGGEDKDVVDEEHQRREEEDLSGKVGHRLEVQRVKEQDECSDLGLSV